MAKPSIVISDRFSAPSQVAIPAHEAPVPEPSIAPLVAPIEAPKEPKDKKAPKHEA